MTKGFLIPPLASLLIACNSSATPGAFTKLGPDPLPHEGFESPPSEPLQPDSLVIKPENMASFYDHPGEAGLITTGQEYGFDFLSPANFLENVGGIRSCQQLSPQGVL